MVASITHTGVFPPIERRPSQVNIDTLFPAFVPIGGRFNYGLAVGLYPAASGTARANDLLSWPAEPLSDREEGRVLRNRSC